MEINRTTVVLYISSLTNSPLLPLEIKAGRRRRRRPAILNPYMRFFSYSRFRGAIFHSYQRDTGTPPLTAGSAR